MILNVAHSGYLALKTESVTYLALTWGPDPIIYLLIAFDCGPLDNPLNGTVDVGSTTVSSEARYTCDSGFDIIGNEVRMCEVDSAWSGMEPECRRELLTQF